MNNVYLLHSVDVLWISVSSALKMFDLPLLKNLSQHYRVARWEYSQSLDEGSSLDTAIALLHDYLKPRDRRVHLMGHGTGGLLALLYANNYPEQVQSVTLLSVGVYPSIDWQAHYYAQLRLLPCPRSVLLQQTVYNLFGMQSPAISRQLIELLEEDLQKSLSMHTLYRSLRLSPRGVSMPLMVCGSQDDIVVDPNLQAGWQPWLKENDRRWQCSKGRYFFHYFYPDQVAQPILEFLQDQENCQYQCQPTLRAQ